MDAGRRFTIATLLGPLLAASAASADFVGIETEEDLFALDGVTTLESLGLGHLRVINVYAAFDDPDDQVLVVFGSPSRPFLVGTDGGSGFVNVPGSLGGGKRPPTSADLAETPELNADTFLTIGNRIADAGPDWNDGSAFEDAVFTMPGAPGPNVDPWMGGDANLAWMVPNTMPPPSGVGYESPPQAIAGSWPLDRVLLMRLVVDSGVGVTGTFGLMIRENGGPPTQVTGYFVHEPAPFLGESDGDQLGRAVANAGDVNGDGFDDIIIGAPLHDWGGADTGKILVYSGSTETLLFERTGEQPGDRYGSAVAGAGDVNQDGYDDFIVGAPFRAGERGRAYVYSGQSGQLLYAPMGAAAGDRFGTAVAGGGDVDGDSGDDFLVGAPRANGSAGAATVFRGASGVALGTIAGEHGGDGFGASVAMIGRADGDGRDDFAVGAPKNDDAGSKAGKVTVFSGASLAPLYGLTGKAAGDQFGRAVAAVGDLDGDARGDFVVGSPLHDKGGKSDVGRVDAFSGADGAGLWQKKGKKQGDKLGTAVAAAGDVDGDHVPDVVIGSPKVDTSLGSNVGRIFVRSGQDGSPLLKLDGQSGGEQFGYAVAGLVGVDGQQAGQLVIGAPKSDAGAPASGRVYVMMTVPQEAGYDPDMDDAGVADPTDLDRDGRTDVRDVVTLVLHWGLADGVGDLDGDGRVDASDLVILLDAWR